MTKCLRCGRFIDVLDGLCADCDPREGGGTAPRSTPAAALSTPRPDDSEHREPLAPIARFTNAAEAGYFAHELQLTAGLPIVLNIEEHFDAVAGHWTTRFVLAAPEPLAAQARQELFQLLDEADPAVHLDAEGSVCVKDEWTEPRHSAGGVGDEAAVNWVPIVLTLAAGSVAFWGFQQFERRPRAADGHALPGRQLDDLWDQLSRSPAPWTQHLEDGRGQRELWFDRRHNVAVIREDADGDGFYERETPFRRVLVHR